MKIGSILTATLILTALAVGPVFSYDHGATCKDSAGTDVGFVRSTAESVEIHLTGETIPTSGYIEVIFADVAAFDALQMEVVTSTGNGQAGNATANVSYRITDEVTNYELSSVTHTEGTPITTFDSNLIRYRINSEVAAPALITGNILITND